jgi:hypothetical protein
MLIALTEFLRDSSSSEAQATRASAGSPGA